MAGSSRRDDPLRRGGSKNKPISLIGDDDDAVSSLWPQGYSAETIAQYVGEQRRAFCRVDEGDEARDEMQRIADEAEVDEEIKRIVDLTQDDEDDALQLVGHVRRRQRNPSSHQSVQSCTTKGFQVKINCFVELVQPVGDWYVQFIEVKQIWVNATSSKATIRGIPYSRTWTHNGRFPRKLNEVCQILEIDCDDPRPDEEQAMMEIDSEQVLAVRTCNKTNASFPQFRFGDDPSWHGRPQKDKEEGAALTCRWKSRVEYTNAGFRAKGKSYAAAQIHLTEDDIEDRRYRVPDGGRREEWRGAATPILPGHRYTFVDTFCGAGGATRGAVMEHFEVRFVADVCMH